MYHCICVSMHACMYACTSVCMCVCVCMYRRNRTAVDRTGLDMTGQQYVEFARTIWQRSASSARHHEKTLRCEPLFHRATKRATLCIRKIRKSWISFFPRVPSLWCLWTSKAILPSVRSRSWGRAAAVGSLKSAGGLLRIGCSFPELFGSPVNLSAGGRTAPDRSMK